MCGFAGLLSHSGERKDELETIARDMIRPIAHRGPDDQGTWVDASVGVAFGFRRLAILDLSEQGHQPMRSGSGRFAIVYNGEVYNHLELRKVLKGDGWSFRGHSDTETILAAFERWGIRDAVSRFVGMFALAVWDAERRELSLVRDRLGIKPLFIGWTPGRVTFGSELKALVEAPGFDRSLNRDAVESYLRFLYVPAPESIYSGVTKLPAGHILTLRRVDEPPPDPAPYWSVAETARVGAATPFDGSAEEAVEALHRLLEDSVRLRLLSDVPLGTLLSGGIDSSVVTAIAQAASPRPIQSFSIGFDRPEFNEAPDAARIATHLGTDHTELMVTGAEALALVPRLPDLFDEPFADPSQIPTFLVCEMARSDVTVALSGDGGDEIFAGYHRYIQGERMIGRVQQLPRPVRRAVGAGIGRLSSTSWDRAYRAVSPALPRSLRYRLPGQKIVKVGALMNWDSEPDMYRSLLSAWQCPSGLLQREGRRAGPVERAFESCAGRPLLERMLLTDQATYLADDLLAKVDRVSMAVSLEVRVPLIDHRIVELSWRLPRELKVRDGQGKWVLRRVLDRYVPRHLIDRPKMGFSVPIADWLRGPLRDWGEDFLASPRLTSDSLLHANAVRRAWSAFQSGQDELALGMWALLMLQAWRARWE